MNRKSIVAIIISVFAISAAYFLFINYQTDNDPKKIIKQSVTKQKVSEKSFDKNKFSITDPASIWVVVDKQRPMQPKTYEPQDLVYPKVSQRVPSHDSMRLRKEAAESLELMFAEANKEGLKLEISSGYRTYKFQSSLYNGYVKKQSREVADTQSARPGYSEHQTGLAVDIQPDDGRCHLDVCFADLPEGKWLSNNAYKYGFIISYPDKMQHITGYVFEPWHFRYVGRELSQEMNNKQVLTLQQMFGLSAAANYN